MLFTENPTTPVVYVTFTRKAKHGQEAGLSSGNTASFTMHPTKMKYVSSVTAADMLEITVPDPDRIIIDEPMLVEDFKTEVEFRFGYEDTAYMSEPIMLLFYRQKPEFPDNGPITTTLICYDKGVFFKLQTKGRGFKKKGGYTATELMQTAVADVNEEFDEDIELNLEGIKSVEGLHFRVTKAPGSYFEFLYWLNEAMMRNPDDDSPCEIFVRNNTLFVRPSNKNKDIIGKYFYHSHIPGELLLAFSPEVNLRPQFKVVGGVDQKSGNPIEEHGANKAGPNRPSLSPGVIAIDGRSGAAHRLIPATSSGDEKKPQVAARKIIRQHVWQKGETLLAIAEKYGSTVAMIKKENGIADENNLQLTPGQNFKVPVLVEGGTVTTPETKNQSYKAYLAEEIKHVTASASVIGDPTLQAGWPILIRNVGWRWDMKWYMTEVEHELDSGGYKCNLRLCRDGVPVAEGVEASTSTGIEKVKDNASVVSPKEQKNRVKINAISGAAGLLRP